jgi:cell division initiation protein
MTITPVEIRHVKLKRGLAGYRRRAADELLGDIVTSYEETWRDRAELRDEVERLQAEVARFNELERLLRDTLLSAERAADTLRADAQREYELLLQEARLRSRELVEEAEAERERINAEVRRLEAGRELVAADLRAALAHLDGGRTPVASSDESEETGELEVPGRAA